jgi:AraC-like DNA-binding protein
MMHPDFELLHFRDSTLSVIGDHYHDYYEIYFINSGAKVDYYIEGTQYKLKPNDILIINSMDVHRLEVDGDSVYDRVVLWLAPQYLKGLGSAETDLSGCFENTGKNKNRNLLRLPAEMLSPLKNSLIKIEKAYFGQNFGNDILIKSYLCEFLVLLNRANLDIADEILEDDIGTNKLIESALRHINKNLSEDLSLDRLSEHLFVSKYHLLREFKRNVGYTVHQYILIKRLLMAEELLSKSDMSITEICLQCGFGDYSNFMRLFTKHYGIPPSQFAKRAKLFNSDQLPDQKTDTGEMDAIRKLP